MRACRTLLILYLTFMLSACGGKAMDSTARGQIRVRVASVGYDQESGTHYVLLEEHAGGRSLPIMIGEDEARAIRFELHGIKPERPLTYQLLQKVIHATGNHLDRVVIANVHDEIYFARIILDHGRYVIDSRPSDAITLAIGLKAPIFVSDELFESRAATTSAPETPPPTISGLGLTVQELSPALAEYFRVPPRIGVVVADLDSNAANAGISRGDIITRVGHREVTTPREFGVAAAAQRAANVTLTVRRGKDTHRITLKRESLPPISAL
ncbi:MAG: bifunctional nuclease domain-containing protein [Candidatus Binataceae bacterium]